MSWPEVAFRSTDEELSFLRAHARVTRLVDAILEDCLERGLGLEAALDVFLAQCSRLLGAADGFVQLWGTQGPVLTRRLGARWIGIDPMAAPEGAQPHEDGFLFVKHLALGSKRLGAFGLYVAELPLGEVPLALALVDAMGEQLDSALLSFVALADGCSPAQRLDELSAADRFHPHSRIGRYELLLPLGAGGMAQVFVARQVGPEGLGRLVALKRILPHLQEEPEIVEQFLDEARIGLKLSHPNLATVYDFGRTPAGYYLAMELIRGASFHGLIQRGGPIEPAVAVAVVCQALRGLHAAHELRGDDGCSLGLVHRDLSPHNVMVGFDGAVKVLDFGIAKSRGQRSKTTVGLLKGKALYMSPEQALGHQLDRRSDLFSAGLMLYEAITGERLFKRGNELATLEAIVSAPAERHPKIPERLWTVLERALAKNRADRPATAADLASELLAALPAAPEHAVANLARERFAETWRASRCWDAAASEPSETASQPLDGSDEEG